MPSGRLGKEQRTLGTRLAFAFANGRALDTLARIKLRTCNKGCMCHTRATEINAVLDRHLASLAWKYSRWSTNPDFDDVIQTLRLGALRAIKRVDETRSETEQWRFVVRSAEFYLMSELDIRGGIRCPSGMRGLRNAAQRKLRRNQQLSGEEIAKLGALLFTHDATSDTDTLESGSAIWGSRTAEIESGLQVKLLLDTLSAEQALLISLVYLQEFSHDEAAAILGTTKSTIRSRLQSAKRELRRELLGVPNRV